ncbi:hypothetical protein C0995_003496 [Termitomyces sp. Mi166|nr:hypothetical protein C0995_003496 [Termitomyces sp. Mi166\
MPAHTYSSPPLQPQASYPDPTSPVMPPTPRISSVPLPLVHTPSPNPSATSEVHPSVVLHPLLRYSQHQYPTLVWDVRTDPTSLFVPVAHDDMGTMSAFVPEDELHEPATVPPRPVLYLFCGIAPPTSTWGIITVVASSSQNSITVLDVLNAVRECMRTPIIQAEWDALCEKQQDRVNRTFDSRWRMSGTPTETRGEGVLRQDCLLRHTLWGGLTPSFVEEDAVVLTLRRDP